MFSVSFYGFMDGVVTSQGKLEMWISGAFASSVLHKFTRIAGSACRHSSATGSMLPVVSSGTGSSHVQESQAGLIKPLLFPGDLTQALRRWEPCGEGSSSPTVSVPVTFCPCCI